MGGGVTDTTSILFLNFVLLLVFLISLLFLLEGYSPTEAAHKPKTATLPPGLDPGLAESWLSHKLYFSILAEIRAAPPRVR